MKICEIITEAGPLPFTKEGVDDIVISKLRTECAPYIAELGSLYNAIAARPLWRGIPDFDWNEFELPIVTISVNQNRSPRDISKETHETVDDWFYSKTGIPFRRASIFGSGWYKVAKQYATDFDTNPGGGTTAVVLPVGKYSYCWSDKIDDLYSYLDEHVMWSMDPKENQKNIFGVLDNAEYKFNTGLGPALVSGHEIMVHCQRL